MHTCRENLTDVTFDACHRQDRRFSRPLRLLTRFAKFDFATAILPDDSRTIDANRRQIARRINQILYGTVDYDCNSKCTLLLFYNSASVEEDIKFILVNSSKKNIKVPVIKKKKI